MNIKYILNKDVYRIDGIEKLEPVSFNCEKVHFIVHFEIAMHVLHFGNKSAILLISVSVIASQRL